MKKEKDGTDVWVVGVIELEVTIDGRGATARKVAFLIVKRRDAETLTNFIVDRVWGGSILISDSWRGYTAFLQRMSTHCVSTTASSTGRRRWLEASRCGSTRTTSKESGWRFVRRSVVSRSERPARG